MTQQVQLAVASGSEDLIPTLLEKMRGIAPGLPLYLLSEFKIEGAQWIPYHPGRTVEQNLALCRSKLADKRLAYVGLILQPRMPYWPMRWLAFRLGGLRTLFFNENLDHFMLRPGSLPTIVGHFCWRAGNFLRWEFRPGGTIYTFLWRLTHPSAFRRPLHAMLARMLPGFRFARHQGSPPMPCENPPYGISVIIPSRNGNDLLDRLMPTLTRELAGIPHEILVVDNGSDTAYESPDARTIVHAEPLSFARAVNAGIRESKFEFVLLLNNDMVLEHGFFAPLLEAFRSVPSLFCATAQIFHPPGERREETGKAVMPAKRKPDEFPVTCEMPLQGEDLSYVLYGSGGCSLFDARKLKQLGGLLEIYQPAYVEDLDLGFRGWQRGWPSVFVAGAKVEHRHRATTSRYYSPEQLGKVLEVNYLKFLAGTVSSPQLFRRLWNRAIDRLNFLAAQMKPDPAAAYALAQAWSIPRNVPPPASYAEDRILAIGSGDTAVFPGKHPSGKPVVLVASPYIPFPLSHGGAVRMYNLMRRAAPDFDQALVCFVDELKPPPREMLEICVEIVLVRREGSHSRPLTSRPGVVEEFDSPAFHAALPLMVEKWKASIAQLEFTQTALYAPDCAPAKTILVEHDVTLDLYRQMLERGEDWETRQQYERWSRFETEAWSRVDSIVTMSEKDRLAVARPNAAVLANGVDLSRFEPSAQPPEANRILFIGSFAHLPNILAIDFFLRECWPAIREQLPAVLHIIAGSRHRYFLEHYQDRIQPDMFQPDVEIEDFVSDPRPAYSRAAIVIAPLLASAGTNIKIMEAMAMGKAVVSTPAGINGLDDLRDGFDVVVANDGEAMAGAVVELLQDPARRERIERQARATVEQRYGWDAIAKEQKKLYERLL